MEEVYILEMHVESERVRLDRSLVEDVHKTVFMDTVTASLSHLQEVVQKNQQFPRSLYDQSSVSMIGITRSGNKIERRVFPVYAYVLVECVPGKATTVAKSLKTKGLLFGIVNVALERKRPLYFYGRKAITYIRVDLLNESWRRYFAWNARSIASSQDILHVHERDVDALVQIINRYQWGYYRWYQMPISPRPRPEDVSMIPDPGHAHVRVLVFDIECLSHDPQRMPDASLLDDHIMQIGVSWYSTHAVSETYQSIVLSISPDRGTSEEHAFVRWFPDEYALLVGFWELIHTQCPDVIIGYNCFAFDWMYIKQRCDLLCAYYSGLVVGWNNRMNTQGCIPVMTGMTMVDLYGLFRRDVSLHLDNYKLDTVAHFYLHIGKVDLPVKELFSNYLSGESQRFLQNAEYCKQDVDITAQLMDRTDQWIALVEMCRLCNISVMDYQLRGPSFHMFPQLYRRCYQDARFWEDSVFVDNAFNTGYPDFVINTVEKYDGGYVFDPDIGMHTDVVSFDFSSLYPSMIIAHNIDYSTLVHPRCAPASSFVSIPDTPFMFSTQESGIIPFMMSMFVDQRKQVRTQMKTIPENSLEFRILEKRQLALKICANSIYGLLGSKSNLRFRMAAISTTTLGRIFIHRAKDALCSQFHAKFIYGDTDSCYVQFPQVREIQQLFSHCEDVEVAINNLSLFPSPMKLAFEGRVFHQFLILEKKHYVGRVKDREGIISNEYYAKGVPLHNRGFCVFQRRVYQKLLDFVFANTSVEEVAAYLDSEIACIREDRYSLDDFALTSNLQPFESYKKAPAHAIFAKQLHEQFNVPYYAGSRIRYLLTDFKPPLRFAIRGAPASAKVRQEHLMMLVDHYRDLYGERTSLLAWTVYMDRLLNSADKILYIAYRANICAEAIRRASFLSQKDGKAVKYVVYA